MQVTTAEISQTVLRFAQSTKNDCPNFLVEDCFFQKKFKIDCRASKYCDKVTKKVLKVAQSGHTGLGFSLLHALQ